MDSRLARSLHSNRTHRLTKIPKAQFIGIDNVDVPIYRIFRLDRLADALTTGKLTLVQPDLWHDPFERLLEGLFVTYEDDPSHSPIPVLRARRLIYGQCWSCTNDSDTLWKAYSQVRLAPADPRRHESRDAEGVQVKTTPRKLMSALWQATPIPQGESCFIGQVTYLTEPDALQRVADIVGHHGTAVFDGVRATVDAMLVKRRYFADEREVRLLHLPTTPPDPAPEVHCFNVPIHELFDEIVFDPRLIEFERKEREAEVRALGYVGSIPMSSVYMRPMVTIRLKGARPRDL